MTKTQIFDGVTGREGGYINHLAEQRSDNKAFLSGWLRERVAEDG